MSSVELGCLCRCRGCVWMGWNGETGEMRLCYHLLALTAKIKPSFDAISLTMSQ